MSHVTRSYDFSDTAAGYRELARDLGALLAIGSAAGAWAGAHLAVERGAAFVRIVLIAILALSVVALLGDIRLI